MKEKAGEKNFRESGAFIFALGAAVGALLFFLVYGTRVLDFTYDAWIFKVKDPDIHQHYLGWCFFRRSRWFFPPGLMDNMSYPYRMSVLWTDSIPLFAIFFKAFRGILPETFQYLGFYGLLSCALTGGTAALLIKKLTGSTAAAFLSVPFFAMSFPMLQRMFYHTSLTAHYLIIIPLLLWLFDTYKWPLIKKVPVWGLYFLAAVMLHPYLWAMGAVIACFVFAEEIFLTRKLIPALVTGAVSAALTYAGLFLMGAFYGNVEASYAFGGFESNLNTFINSLGFSSFLPALPLQNVNQYEGFGYLGLGGMLIPAAGVFLFLRRSFKGSKGSRGFGVSRRELLAALMILVFFIMAVFPEITVNSKLMIGIKPHGIVGSVLGIFRSNGRFIWPVMILLYAGGLREIVRYGVEREVNRIPGIIIGILLILQLADMGKEVYIKHSKFTKAEKQINYDLENEALLKVLDRYDRIVLVTEDQFRTDRCACFALKYGMPINRYYFARNIDSEIEKVIDEYHRSCSAGDPPGNVIFVFDEETMAEWKKDTDLLFYDLTGTIVGLAEEIDLPVLQ